MPVKSAKKRKSEASEGPNKKIEILFQPAMWKRMSSYKKDHGFFKMQELVRVSVGNFLQKQGY
jgi:hypothetical protein